MTPDRCTRAPICCEYHFCGAISPRPSRTRRSTCYRDCRPRQGIWQGATPRRRLPAFRPIDAPGRLPAVVLLRVVEGRSYCVGAPFVCGPLAPACFGQAQRPQVAAEIRGKFHNAVADSLVLVGALRADPVASVCEHHLAAFQTSPAGLPAVRLSNGHFGLSKSCHFCTLPLILTVSNASPVPNRSPDTRPARHRTP